MHVMSCLHMRFFCAVFDVLILVTSTDVISTSQAHRTATNKCVIGMWQQAFRSLREDRVKGIVGFGLQVTYPPHLN